MPDQFRPELSAASGRPTRPGGAVEIQTTRRVPDGQRSRRATAIHADGTARGGTLVGHEEGRS